MTEHPRPHFNTVRNPWANRTVTAGSHTADRLPNALWHPNVMVRPNTLAEAFAAAGVALGAKTPTLARNATHASPWARVFQAEPAFLLAELLAFNTHDAAHTFSETLDSDPRTACRMVSELAEKVQDWITRINADMPDLFSKQIKQMNVEAQLNEKLEAFAGASVKATRDAAEAVVRGRTSMKDAKALKLAEATGEALRNTHATLRNALTTLRPQAQDAFDKRIHSGQMDPALGLLIAELRTAAHVDAAMNEMPARHRTHYYSDILGQHPAPASPERVLLGLETTAQARHIPRGAAIEALLPDGSVQQFETEAHVPLSPAHITDIRTLSYQTDPKISFNKVLSGITRVRAATVTPGPQAGPRSLFSAGQSQPATMGLDITSPMLSLAEGTRRVDVSLIFARPSNLPAQSRVLTNAEIAERNAHWSETGTGCRRASDVPSELRKLRRPLDQNPRHVDPDVRLALASDPELVTAFFQPELFNTRTRPGSMPPEPMTTETLLADFAHEVTETAQQNTLTPSLELVYELLADRVASEGQLRLLLGRILTICLIEDANLPHAATDPPPIGPFRNPPRPQTWTALAPKIEAYGLGSIPDTSMVFAAFGARNADGKPPHLPGDIFQALLGDALDVQVSTTEGLRRPDMMQILPLQSTEHTAGITLRFRFDPSAPALVGEEEPDTPRLILRAAQAPRVCPVSFMERYTIKAIEIRTNVTGLRKLASFSDDGPVVTDQTFQPFGPQPQDGATFQLGCAEMGRKPVTDIALSLGWADMPDPIGGFEAHYADYGKNAPIPKPEVTVDYLSGDGWKPVITSPKPLFFNDDITGSLQADWRVGGRITGHPLPADGTVRAGEYKSRQSIRAGLLRLTLTGTGGGFNAAHYPQALVRAMRPRLLPLGTRPIPKRPFVPTVARISLSYSAASTMQLSALESARSGESVTQISPFGAVPVFPERSLRAVRLLPKRLGYGQLSLQISGPRATGPLAIAFDTSKAAHLRRVPNPNPLRWFYLAKGGWTALPDTALSADTTAGLMRAGLVLMDLPEDATTTSPEMPAGGVWIAAVAMEPDLDTFPALGEITVNGVWARRVADTARPDAPGRTWSFAPAQPGVKTLRALTSPVALRPPEAPGAFTARMSERLRHRKRAVTPWDVERLILQEFPEVYMAKCLPHLTHGEAAPAPGHMTLVALRTPPPDAPAHAPCLFDVAALAQMQSFLKTLATDFAAIEVVNPSFERLQVRAKVVLKAHREEGAMARALKDEIARYLSVWTAPPALQRFGWQLNAQLLSAFISEQPSVEQLSEFSVLHLSGDDTAHFELLDTAQDTRDRRGLYGPSVRPRAPWALPLSARDHMLTLRSARTDAPPSPTSAGVGTLGVGDMLIVGQRTRS